MSRNRKDKKSADPNNKFWANDASRFGFKMLQSMGWKEGSGLGKNEDGKTDYLVVEQRPDARGLGAEAAPASQQWTASVVAYDSVLSSLSKLPTISNPAAQSNSPQSSSSTSSDEEDAAPEPKKPAGKPRHFIPNRVLKAKGMKNYGTADIKAILGKTETSEKVQADKAKFEERKRYVSKFTAEAETHELTQTTSLADYFAKRMAAKNGSAQPETSITSTVEEAEPVQIQESEKEATEEPEEIKNGKKPKMKAKKDKKRKRDAEAEAEAAEEEVAEPKAKRSKKAKKDKKEKKADKKSK